MRGIFKLSPVELPRPPILPWLLLAPLLMLLKLFGFGTLKLLLLLITPPDWIKLFRLALGITSSDADEARELHDPPCGASNRTGDALRRIVSSINCFA